MAWGIGWGLLIIFILVLIVAYVIIQETRAQQHWRGLVAGGDVDAVRTLIEDQVEEWRRERPPRDMPASLWQGIQNAELLEVGADYARISTAAEGQYALMGGERREVSSPLDEAMRLTVKLADRFLYDVPNVRLDRVQVDVYTSFRQEHGLASQRCILSTVARRDVAADVDWDGAMPEEIVRQFGGVYRVDELGSPLSVEPIGGEVQGGEGSPDGREGSS